VTVSRSFGRSVGGLVALEAAVASFTANAAERARRHGLKAGALSVFLGWREEGRRAGDSAALRLPPTDDTPVLVRAAKGLVASLFVEGRAFKKAGVALSALEPADSAQAELFDDGRADRSRRLLKAVDRLNAALGPGTLRYGATQASAASASRGEWRSPRWTTVWAEIPTVGA